MTVEETNRYLKTYEEELNRIAATGDTRLLLSWSGEQLAFAAEGLRTASAGDLAGREMILLQVSEPHVMALCRAGMGADALATACMTVMTCIAGAGKPDDFPDVYVGYLQNIFLLALTLANDMQLARVDADGHLSRIAALAGALVMALAKRFEDSLSPEVRDKNTMIHEDLAMLAPSELTFGGREVVPSMTIDICADIVARLKALGLEE